jgi:hypothetical protein
VAEVKGTVINAWKKFLEERYGEHKLSEAIQSLDSQERSALQSPILDSTWYPIALQNVMSKLTKTLTLPADRDIAWELGRYMAEYVYSKVYRMLLKSKPNSSKPIDWFDDVVFRDLRTYVVEASGPASCLVRYKYLEGKPTKGQCRTLQAFISRKLELAGYKKVTCGHDKCLAKGNDCCEFLMQWEAQ